MSPGAQQHGELWRGEHSGYVRCPGAHDVALTSGKKTSLSVCGALPPACPRWFLCIGPAAGGGREGRTFSRGLHTFVFGNMY